TSRAHSRCPGYADSLAAHAGGSDRAADPDPAATRSSDVPGESPWTLPRAPSHPRHPRACRRSAVGAILPHAPARMQEPHGVRSATTETGWRPPALDPWSGGPWWARVRGDVEDEAAVERGRRPTRTVRDVSAGGVVVRGGPAGPEVALVGRGKPLRWGLPKGG